MAQRIERGRIGVLDKIGQGGQGVVYRAPSARTDFAKSMVYKEYKAGVLASLNVAALEAMPEFLESSLTYGDGAILISLASWPCAVVEDAGKTTGFVMPSIPDEFFTDFWTSNKSTPSRVPAEFQHLLNEPQVLAMRFAGNVISDRQRYELLRQVASALLFLHDRGVCVGDISPKNMLFALSPSPAVYFIDCDAMRVNGASLSQQMESPGWQVPAGEDKATVYSDRYKLGLLALRLILGSQDAADPGRLPASTPAELRRIITDTVTNPPHRRPDLASWDRALAAAIATAPQHTPTPAPPPRPASPPMVTLTPPPTAPSTPAAQTGPVRISQPSPPTTAASTPIPAPARSNKAWWLIAAAAVPVLIAVAMAASHTNTNTATSRSTSTTYDNNYPPTATNRSESTPTRTSTTTVTSTQIVAAPSPQTPAPSWDGPWLRNYSEGEQDCNSGGRYWVVQPGDGDGLYALKVGCFPQQWITALNQRCQASSLPPGKCAVWDPNSIMSVFNTRGDLEVVALTQDCLDRAGQNDFHQGPLHQYCMVEAGG
jgi:serine/threonine protein kinase